MAAYPTLTEIKDTERERKRSAVVRLREKLATYAAAHGGRFILYGSAARDTMRHDSDVDILTDFPPDALDDAWVFAEEACWRLRLTPDIRPRAWCSQRFLDHIAPDAVILS
jgi:predicted nucleotidyltransferase